MTSVIAWTDDGPGFPCMTARLFIQPKVIMESVLANGPPISVECKAGIKEANWNIGGKKPHIIPVKRRELVQINITVPGKFVRATLFSGPRAPGAQGPLFGENSIKLNQNTTLHIDHNARGHWGFSIMIESAIDGISNFFFLPDPELEVDSTET